jgi:hypothetical protein
MYLIFALSLWDAGLRLQIQQCLESEIVILLRDVAGVEWVVWLPQAAESKVWQNEYFKGGGGELIFCALQILNYWDK